MYTNSNDKIERKKEKKLKKCLDKTLQPYNRFKFLIEFLEKCTEVEAETVFNVNAFELFSLTHEVFNSYELQCLKGKFSRQSIFQFHDVLKKFLIYLSSNIYQRWQVRTISIFLQKSLDVGNVQHLRKVAFENLLLFYRALKKPEREFISLLPTCLSLDAFSAEYPVKPIISFKPFQTETLLLPKQNSPRIIKEESTELLTIFLNFISSDPSEFERWFELFTKNLLNIFYPTTMLFESTNNQLGSQEGFISHCPYDIQCILIDWLQSWFKTEVIYHCLLTEYIDYLFEIYFQSCFMPSLYCTHIVTSISIFYDALFVQTGHGLNEETLRIYRIKYLRHFSTMLTGDIFNADGERIISKLVSIYHIMVEDNWFKNDQGLTQIFLQSSLTLTSNAVLRVPYPKYDFSITSTLIDLILHTWIYKLVDDPSSWSLLQKTLRELFSISHVIPQCKLKLVQLTHQLLPFMFTFEKHNKIENRYKTPQSRRNESVFTDTIPFIDANTEPMVFYRPVDWEMIRFIWINMLNIFLDVGDIKDTSIYYECTDTIVTIGEILLTAQERSDWKSPSPSATNANELKEISIISVFGTWLFESLKKPVDFIDGKALAIRTLCHIFVRHYPIYFSLDLLGYFYDGLKTSLTKFSTTKVSWAILEQTALIFSIALPATNLLLVPYFREIEKVFSNVQNVPEATREASIKILGAMFSICVQYNDFILDQELNHHFKLISTPKDSLPSTSPSFSALKHAIISLLLHILEIESKSVHIVSTLYALNVVTFNEIHCYQETKSPASLTLVQKIIQTILSFINRIDIVSDAVLSSLSNLTSLFTEINQMDPQLPLTICHALVHNIRAHQLDPNVENWIIDHYETLVGWMILMPIDSLQFSSLVSSVFNSIHVILKQKFPNIYFDDGLNYSLQPPMSHSSTLKEKNEEDTVEIEKSNKQAESNIKIKLLCTVEKVLTLITNLINIWPIDAHYDIIESKTIDFDLPEGRKLQESQSVGTMENMMQFSSTTSCKALNTSQLDLSISSNDSSSKLVPKPSPSIKGTEKDSALISTSSTVLAAEDYGQIHSNYPPFQDRVFWFTKNHAVYSIFDCPYHDPSFLVPSVDQALGFTLQSRHYLRYFFHFLKNAGLDDLCHLYFETSSDQSQVKACVSWLLQVSKASWTVRNGDETERKNDPSKITSRMNAMIEKMNQNLQWDSSDPDRPLLSKIKGSASDQVFQLLKIVFKKFRQYKASKLSSCRLITRDYLSKYTWEFRPYYGNDLISHNAKPYGINGHSSSSANNEFRSNILPVSTMISSLLESILPTACEPKSSPTNFSDLQKMNVISTTIPTSNPTLARQSVIINSTSIISLGSLIQAYHRDIFACYDTDFSFEQLSPPQAAICNVSLLGFTQQQQQLDVVITHLRAQKDVSPLLHWLPAEPHLEHGKLDTSSSFLLDMGLLFPSPHHQQSNVTLIEANTSRFSRIIKQLDHHSFGHEVIKIGLIYVKNQQEEQNDILSNDRSMTSKEYNQFVEGMSIMVKLRTHAGYMGGLERSGATGIVSPYWRSAMDELVIHQVTSMPTSQKDPQQILKKRHVGNDIVHVIWSEHARDYNPQTIVSQFNDAHIVVFPLENGLYRVSVAQKRDVGQIGPLRHNMVVTKDIISALVRQTAIEANTVVRNSHQIYMGQFFARRVVLNDVIMKCRNSSQCELIKSLVLSSKSLVSA